MDFSKTPTTVSAGTRRVPILRLEDVVKDRLAAYIHWRDNQSLVQAVTLMLKHQLTPSTYEPFCEREGTPGQYQLLTELFFQAKDRQLNTMEELEAALAQILLNSIK